MLTRFEPELVGWLMEMFSEIGVDMRTGTAVDAIERVGSAFRVHARAGSQEITTEADLVVHALAVCPISKRSTCRRPGLPSRTDASS
jgi:glutathione reductase (NADPH)